MSGWGGSRRRRVLVIASVTAAAVIVSGGAATALTLKENNHKNAERLSGVPSYVVAGTSSLKAAASATPTAAAKCRTACKPSAQPAAHPAAPTATSASARQRTGARTTITLPPSKPMSLVGTLSAIDTVPQALLDGIVVMGGSMPYTWSVSGLPAWLSTSPKNHGSYFVISGTPKKAGTFTFTATVRDSETAPQALTRTYTITINPLPWSTEAPAPLSATVGIPYTGTFSATNGVTVRWAASGLPPGLSMNSVTGTIKGTPVTAGLYTISVSATATATGEKKSAGNFNFLVYHASGG